MRFLVILCCIAVAAHAASLGGYDYQHNPSAKSGFEISSGPQTVVGSAPVAAAAGPVHDVAAPVQYTKEFLTYAAPEDEFDQDEGANQLAESVKRHLRVIFIRGPEISGFENAALNLAKSAADKRTVIYVLSKQVDVAHLANTLKQLNDSHANRPEVHFVKYRTQADADNAQHTIQSQYDSLGGQSSNFDGGVAPVLDFASKSPAVAAANPTDDYLPPNRRA